LKASEEVRRDNIPGMPLCSFEGFTLVQDPVKISRVHSLQRFEVVEEAPRLGSVTSVSAFASRAMNDALAARLTRAFLAAGKASEAIMTATQMNSLCRSTAPKWLRRPWRAIVASACGTGKSSNARPDSDTPAAIDAKLDRVLFLLAPCELAY